MRLRRILATLTIAAVFFWAPSTLPVKAVPAGPCGVGITWVPADTAYATGILLPCPSSGGSSAGASVTGGFIGFVTALAIYDFIRRTTCLGDPWRLGGPGFGEKMPIVGNIMPPQCKKLPH
jgi:hypothetical protein